MEDRADLRPGGEARNSARNHVSGLLHFCRRWDEGTGRYAIAFENARGAAGHVNLAGSAACFSSFIFTPSDPEFVDAIERGVRDLVFFLIYDLNCITYSSCEGHAPVDGNPLRQRHVGVLPRDVAEDGRLLELFRSAADATHMKWDRETVHVNIKEAFITTDGMNVPCIDILFSAVAGDWLSYSRTLEAVYQEFLTYLRHRLAVT